MNKTIKKLLLAAVAVATDSAVAFLGYVLWLSISISKVI